MPYLSEGEDIGLVASAIAFIAFDIDRDIANASETRDLELSPLGFVEKNQAPFAFAEFETEI